MSFIEEWGCDMDEKGGKERLYSTRILRTYFKISASCWFFLYSPSMFNGTKMRVSHGGRGYTGQMQWKESEWRRCRRSSTHIFIVGVAAAIWIQLVTSFPSTWHSQDGVKKRKTV